MKKFFSNRLEAIDWIATNVDNEGQFEVLREQLNYNYIYTNQVFVNIDGQDKEVVSLKCKYGK